MSEQSTSKTKEEEEKEKKWLESLGEVHKETKLPTFWETLGDNAKQWAASVSVGDFWKKAHDNLSDWRKEYATAFKGKLLADEEFPDFESKEHERAKQKLFNQYQGADKKEDHLQESFNYDSEKPKIICSLRDLIRCRIPCSYIDGVEFLTDKLYKLAKAEGCYIDLQKEGKIQGYFAQHLYIKQEVILKRGGFSKVVEVLCEIQIASEMATQMWKKTHPIYEAVRNKSGSPEDWQWDPNNSEFIANQLGHMIHLADGLLVQLKNKK